MRIVTIFLIVWLAKGLECGPITLENYLKDAQSVISATGSKVKVPKPPPGYGGLVLTKPPTIKPTTKATTTTLKPTTTKATAKTTTTSTTTTCASSTTSSTTTTTTTTTTTATPNKPVTAGDLVNQLMNLLNEDNLDTDKINEVLTKLIDVLIQSNTTTTCAPTAAPVEQVTTTTTPTPPPEDELPADIIQQLIDLLKTFTDLPSDTSELVGKLIIQLNVRLEISGQENNNDSNESTEGSSSEEDSTTANPPTCQEATELLEALEQSDLSNETLEPLVTKLTVKVKVIIKSYTESSVTVTVSIDVISKLSKLLKIQSKSRPESTCNLINELIAKLEVLFEAMTKPSGEDTTTSAGTGEGQGGSK